MALAIIGKNLKSFGFGEMDFHEPLDFEEIALEGMSDLFRIAEVLDVDFEEIQRLNPEILRWFTPPRGNIQFASSHRDQGGVGKMLCQARARLCCQ